MHILGAHCETVMTVKILRETSMSRNIMNLFIMMLQDTKQSSGLRVQHKRTIINNYLEKCDLSIQREKITQERMTRIETGDTADVSLLPNLTHSLQDVTRQFSKAQTSASPLVPIRAQRDSRRWVDQLPQWSARSSLCPFHCSAKVTGVSHNFPVMFYSTAADWKVTNLIQQ